MIKIKLQANYNPSFRASCQNLSTASISHYHSTKPNNRYIHIYIQPKHSNSPKMVLLLPTFQATTTLQPSFNCNYYPTNTLIKHNHYLNLSKTLNPSSINHSRSNHFHKLSAYNSSDSSRRGGRSSHRVVENDDDSLYRRISPVGDWRVSIVPILDQWIQEGRSVNKVRLQRIIRELRKYRRFKHSLEVHFR